MTAKVEDKKNLVGLKVGDKVEITFTEALMVTVDAPKSRAVSTRIMKTCWLSRRRSALGLMLTHCQQGDDRLEGLCLDRSLHIIHCR